MGFAVELCFDARGAEGWEAQLERRRALAEEHGCDSQYFTHEIEGKGRQTLRSDAVQVVTFTDSGFDGFIAFIRALRALPRNCIDCIYEDDTTCKLLYASPRYVRNMGGAEARAFRRERRSWRPTTHVEKAVYEAMGRRRSNVVD